MGDINLTRVLLGGIVAGLVIMLGEAILNGVVLADDWTALRADQLIYPPSISQYAIGTLLTLSYGIVLVWIYAAIRPRFGPGPRTAIIGGLTFWFIAYVLFLLSVWANGFVSLNVAAVSILWGVFEAPIAALAGAWVYREAEARYG